MSPLNLAFILLTQLASRISCIEAIRDDRKLRDDDRDRRMHQATKQNTISEYYTYSQGRGGVSKQEEIPESPSITPSIDPSTVPSDFPSSVPLGSPPTRTFPSSAPSNEPSGPRSAIPSPNPSERPSAPASDPPSDTPSIDPTLLQSSDPSIEPSVVPSSEPSERLSAQPSTRPSLSLSSNPSATPSRFQYSYDDAFVAHNFVGSPQWPGDSAWQSELGSFLSSGASLTNNMMITTAQDFLSVCENVTTIAEFRAKPVCIPIDDCQFQFCNLDGMAVNNLPAYTVDVRTPGDITQALNFAERHNIQVSIKTTGHNFAGASLMKNSLNILMANYPKDGTVKTIFTDSCGTNFIPTIGINGGEVWGDVYDNFKRDYHVLSGDTRSVSAAGGWLQGVGLSHTSRMYGVGVDHVASFDVILPNGRQVTADACTNPDLFWALRGGGGGTFGVVTHVEYKMLPKTKITTVYFEMDDPSWLNYRAIRLFLEYWIGVTPTADRRVGGAYFGSWYFEVFVLGDVKVAEELFTLDFCSWYNNTYKAAGYDGYVKVKEVASFYDYMGGDKPLEEERVSGGNGQWVSTRLVPEVNLVDDPGGFLDFLMELQDYEWWDSYWLGGAVNDVLAGHTAVHPAMRSAVWAISTWDIDSTEVVRRYLPDGISGSSFNHQGASELNWRVSLWGEENYKRLLGIKNRYDPHRRLNCWHCVGYQGEEYERV